MGKKKAIKEKMKDDQVRFGFNLDRLSFFSLTFVVFFLVIGLQNQNHLNGEHSLNCQDLSQIHGWCESLNIQKYKSTLFSQKRCSFLCFSDKITNCHTSFFFVKKSFWDCCCWDNCKVLFFKVASLGNTVSNENHVSADIHFSIELRNSSLIWICKQNTDKIKKKFKNMKDNRPRLNPKLNWSSFIFSIIFIFFCEFRLQNSYFICHKLHPKWRIKWYMHPEKVMFFVPFFFTFLFPQQFQRFCVFEKSLFFYFFDDFDWF